MPITKSKPSNYVLLSDEGFSPPTVAFRSGTAFFPQTPGDNFAIKTRELQPSCFRSVNTSGLSFVVVNIPGQDLGSGSVLTEVRDYTRQLAASAAPSYKAETVKSITDAKGRHFRLVPSETCVISSVDGVWTHAIPRLRIYGYGRTEEESSANLALDLAACWDEIVLESDDALTADAIQLKRLLKTRVRLG